jgi:hypothetical protein
VHAEGRLFVLNKDALTVLPDRGLTDHCFLLSGTPKKTIEGRLEEVIDNG